jgi:hypothetical protein
MLSRQIKYIEEDQRINELLTILRERNVGNTFSDTESREHLTAESLDPVSWGLITWTLMGISVKQISFFSCL